MIKIHVSNRMILQNAKGDQCDNCGSMLNPVELIKPRCKITGTTPVLRKTKHLFLDLPKLTAQLQEYVDETSELGGWSANCIAVSLLKQTFSVLKLKLSLNLIVERSRNALFGNLSHDGF